MNRKPFFAGRFYPATREMLSDEINSYAKDSKNKIKSIGIVSPHAGYIYSGRVAAEVFSSVKLPKKFIILSPNHTGMGERISLWGKGSWTTPYGEALIDEELSKKLLDSCDKIKLDTQAHLTEHSLEVQLPFIQHFCPEFKFVPITLSYLSLDTCKELGLTIANVLKNEEETLIVASSDMTHFEDSESAKKKDTSAIERIENLDPEGLYNTVREKSISMCGVIPTTVMLYAAKELGAKKGTLIRYTNSGETSGDYDEVVGYAGMYVG